jgi:AraC-like DNA-binding protein
MEGPWFWPAYPGPRLRFHAAPGFDSWFHRHVGFTGPRVAHWVAEGLWFTQAQPAPSGGDWPSLVDELIARARRPGQFDRLRAGNLLESVLIALAEDRAKQEGETARGAWLSPILTAIEQATQRGEFVPNFAQIAQECGMGESTLRRRFKQATGLSPHGYVQQSRLSRARVLLADTDLPLAQIAERLGYDSVYYFAKQFKQAVKVAPGAFRKGERL